MKKTSTIVKEKRAYQTLMLINNTACIRTTTGKTGLLNIKTGKLIGNLDNYNTIYYDESGQFYTQIKKIEDPTKENWQYPESLRFYDAKEERLLVDGWKIIELFDLYHNLCAVESPVDGKIHIFDKSLWRSTINIFDNGFDSVKFLYENGYCVYLTVTINGKTGIYCKGKGLITPIEFDEIEIKSKITIFTKNSKKYFAFNGEFEKNSIEFDEIKFDKNNSNIVYCKLGSTIFTYNTIPQVLILKLDCEDIRFVEISGDNYDGTFFFIFKNNNKYGIVSAEMSYLNRKIKGQEPKENILLSAIYDNINYDHGFFCLNKNAKVGVFADAGYKYVCIEPKYDRIENLGKEFYAFYTGEYCDIFRISSPSKPLITGCKIVENLDDGLIFEKNNLYWLFQPNIREFKYKYSSYEKDIVLDNYDKIKHLGKGYFELEKNGKKGVNYRGLIIIPLEYDEIELNFQGHEKAYFLLEKAEKVIELVKKRHSDYIDSEVEVVSNHTFDEIKFFNDIMVLKDKTNCLIYNYDEERLLKVLPVDTEIEQICYDKKILYRIDGIFYFYGDGRFEEAYMENCDLYVTIYESDYGLVVVNSYDKAKHEEKCKLIEDGGKENFDQTLISIYEKNPKIQEKYPTLVKRLFPSKSSNNK